jgi:mono/diheme cytochrome c family protein
LDSEQGGVNMKRTIFALSLAVVTVLALYQSCRADESVAERRQLFRAGAKLWPVYCAQCHNARPGSEFAPYQWDAIIMHMRTLANLPAKDARAVLEYLKSSH